MKKCIYAGKIRRNEDDSILFLERESFPHGIIKVKDFLQFKNSSESSKCNIYSKDSQNIIGYCFKIETKITIFFLDSVLGYGCQWDLISELQKNNRNSIDLFVSSDIYPQFPKKNSFYSIIDHIFNRYVDDESYDNKYYWLRYFGISVISEINYGTIDYNHDLKNFCYCIIYYPYSIETLYHICSKYQENIKDSIQNGKVKISVIGAGPAPEIIGMSLFFNQLQNGIDLSFTLFDKYNWMKKWNREILLTNLKQFKIPEPKYQNYICDFFKINSTEFQYIENISESDCIVISNLIESLLVQKKNSPEIFKILLNILNMMKEGSILIISDNIGKWKPFLLFNNFLDEIKKKEKFEIITESVQYGCYKPNFNENDENFSKWRTNIEDWYKQAYIKQNGKRRENTEFCFIIIKKKEGIISKK